MRSILAAITGIVFLASCTSSGSRTVDLSTRSSIEVVATTNLVADLVSTVGGEHVEVTSLMGPGVDPHLYKASAGDVARMSGAEMIFYSGLHLEGKMVEIFEQMVERGKYTFPVTHGIERDLLIESVAFGGNYDPHIWFDVALWKKAAVYVSNTLKEVNPANAGAYDRNLAQFLDELNETDKWIRDRVAALPEEQRVLITSHDAFGYFGRAYGFEVHGLQGISTVLEAGTADVQALAKMVADRSIPAIFVESSVPPRGIEAVREAVRARGVDVEIGGNLFSDALGRTDTPEGRYTGMVRYNVNTIVDGLSRQITRKD